MAKPIRKKLEVQHNKSTFQIKLKQRLLIGAIILYTFLLFSKTLTNDFVNWDDPFYLQQNMLIQDLSWNNIVKIFKTPVIGMYNPLTFLTFAIEHHFWKFDPHPYHFFNLLFHLINVWLVYIFICRLTKNINAAAIVALLFAIHPLHVGAVAWISQRKTVLFAIFYFLALIEYLKFIESDKKTKNFILIIVYFILSLLSKPSAVSLPLILLLIDYYIGRKYTLKTLIEKIPFFAISLTIGLVNIISHKTSGDVIFESKAFSLLNTILISNYSLVFYFNKLFFPLNLSVIYPYPSEHLVLPLKYFISILIIPFVLFLLFKSGKFKKDFIFGLLFFFLSIIILLRIIPSGFFYAANRYSYISYTGLFFIIAQFFCWVMDNKFSFSKQIKNYVIIFFIGLFIFYSVSTIYRVKVWENSITLFDDIIEKHPNLDIAYNNRGIAKKDLLDYQGAIDDFSKAAEVNPKFAAAYNNRGEIRRILNQNDLAMADFNKAILINDKYVEAYNNRGIIYYNYGKFKLALEDYNQAAILSPKNNVIYHNRGNIKLMLKDTAGACRDWNRAEQFGNTAVRKIIDFYCK